MGPPPVTPPPSSRLFHWLGILLALAVASLAALAAAESLARLWVPLPPPDDVRAGRALADVYAGESWPVGYFEELRRARQTQWRPYLYWQRRAFHGTYIDIDERGRRRTWQPPRQGRLPRRVFVFGGSVVWGEGARDEHTIPSYLAKALAEAGFTDVEVTNFGESGYVSMQEVIQLQEELRRGRIPDVAVFLDGVNELFGVRQSGVPGITHNETNRVREFNIDVDGRIYREAALTLLHHSALYRAARGLVAPAPAGAPSETIDRLAADTVRLYLATIEIARDLGRSYHFDTLFYWQPIIFTKVHLSPWETTNATGSRFEEFFARSYAVAAEILAEAPHVRDLSGLFAEEREPRYIDFCHLGERGNEDIGREIARDVIPLFGGTMQVWAEPRPR